MVKTCQSYRGQDSSAKVFINVVSHEAIELPQFNQNSVDEQYLDNKGLEGLRVPLLVAPPRQVTDHAGATATAIDVVFNTWVVGRCLEQRPSSGYDTQYYRMRVAELAMRYAREV
eukprot:SAG11_NODE_2162_length_3729_cov_1.561433_1_plen_115_part_00